MKVENKTIIITDPCYIINEHEDKKPKWKDYPELAEISPRTKFSDYTPEQTIAYKKDAQGKTIYDEFNIDPHTLSAIWYALDTVTVADVKQKEFYSKRG